MLILEDLTSPILRAATEVHKRLGPGLMESTYAACLEYELRHAGFHVDREVPMTVTYRDIALDTSYRADLVVDGCVLVEIKSVEKLLPVHEAQVLTYLKFSDLPLALLLNFNLTRLKFGIRRFIAKPNPFSSAFPASSPRPPRPL